jgi:hypothetical protein
LETDIISFEAVDDRGTGWYDSLFFIFGGCLVASGLVFVMGTHPQRWMLSVLLITLGISGFSWLLRHLPKTKYFVYFRVDKLGIHYRESPSSGGIMIPWNRITDAKVARYPAGEGEQHGIELAVLSTSGYADTRFLPMHYLYQIDHALQCIRETILQQRTVSNPAFESGRAKSGAPAQRER